MRRRHGEFARTSTHMFVRAHVFSAVNCDVIIYVPVYVCIRHGIVYVILNVPCMPFIRLPSGDFVEFPHMDTCTGV